MKDKIFSQKTEKLVVAPQEMSRDERFKKYIGTQMQNFPQGEFESQLPGVRSINIFPPQPDASGEIDSLHIIISHSEKNYRDTLTLNKKGELIGKIKDLEITKDELYEEILRIAEITSGDDFESVGEDILPPGEWPVFGKKDETEEEKNIERSLPDPRRINFLRNHPDYLFGIRGLNSGFRGYYGFVFPGFILLENEAIGNAVYIFPFDKKIEVENNQKGEGAPTRIRNKYDRKMILDTYWKPIASLTKQESLGVGAVRVIHPPVDDKKWEEKMLEVIDSNLK